jgi:drug/metabolite transporter (DMT)-like permease
MGFPFRRLHPAPHFPALALLICGGACLGVAPVVVKALPFAGEVSAFWRVAISAPIFIAFAWQARAEPPAERREPSPSLLLFAIAAVLFAADLTVMHLAIRLTDVAVATLLTNCAPFFVGVLGLVGFADRPSRRFWIALPIAIGGVFLLLGISGGGGVHLAGDAIALCAAALYGGYLVAVKALRARGASPVAIMAAVTSGSAILISPLFLLAGAPIPVDARTWLLIIVLVLVGQIAGQGLVAIALKRLSVSSGSLVLLIQPAVAGVLSCLLLGENLSPLQLIVIASILAAIWIGTTGQPADKRATSGSLRGLEREADSSAEGSDPRQDERRWKRMRRALPQRNERRAYAQQQQRLHS